MRIKRRLEEGDPRRSRFDFHLQKPSGDLDEVIESLHNASEIPAIKRQAAILAEKLPDVKVEYVPSGATAFLDHDRRA